MRMARREDRLEPRRRRGSRQTGAPGAKGNARAPRSRSVSSASSSSSSSSSNGSSSNGSSSPTSARRGGRLSSGRAPREASATSLLQPVRVAVRVRPIAKAERARGCVKCVRVLAGRQVLLGKDRAFTFDLAFGPRARQGDLFRDCVLDLVDGCFQGYNASVLAYGQTGSGKTYTMGMSAEDARAAAALDGEGEPAQRSGRDENEAENDLLGSSGPGDQLGIVPRVCVSFFEKVQDLPSHIEVSLRVSYLEIYNETVRDLLSAPAADRVKSNLSIRDGGDGNVVVQGAAENSVSNVADMLRQLRLGAQRRTTGSTRMNATSSRSHAIFTITVEQQDLRTCRRRVAKFHLVDLAGSERNKRTGAVGERFHESIQINQGLLALGNVISTLGNDAKSQHAHVPYRQSKLTRLLRDCLGGNSRTLFVACVSPADDNLAETLNTLKYANRARNIKNLPILNDIASSSDEEDSGESEGVAPTCEDGAGSLGGSSLGAKGPAAEARGPGASRPEQPPAAVFSRLQALESRESEWEQERLALLDQVASMERALATPMHPGHLECNARIDDLRAELGEARADLERDEIIFSKKMEDLQQARRQLRALRAECEGFRARIQELERENRQLLNEASPARGSLANRAIVPASSPARSPGFTPNADLEAALEGAQQELRALQTRLAQTEAGHLVALQRAEEGRAAAETRAGAKDEALVALRKEVETLRQALGARSTQEISDHVADWLQGARPDPGKLRTEEARAVASALLARLSSSEKRARDLDSKSGVTMDGTGQSAATSPVPSLTSVQRVEKLDEEYICLLERDVRFLRKSVSILRTELREARASKRALDDLRTEHANLKAFLRRQGTKHGAVPVRVPRAQLAEINLNAGGSDHMNPSSVF